MKQQCYKITLKIKLFLLILLSISYSENPVVQTNFTPDPAPMVYKDTVFLFTGRDHDNATGFTMYDYLLYSSTDLVNWTDHGVVASLKNFSWAPTNGAWAAQCVHRNGKFYYYCSLHGKGIGVLVADSPYGPFKDALGRPLLFHSWNDIDPTVFIDDDGQAYMYWGNPECYWVKLNEDMISYSGKIDSLVPRMKTYQEGPWFYKRNSHYYLAFSSTCCPEGIGYAMSDKPTGPWTYKGSIMDGNSQSPGNQPGIFDFKGKSYTFGFNFAINFALTTVKRERRSACLKEMPYNADGTISKLSWFGGKLPEPGVTQVGSFNPYDTIQAETICFEKGVRTEVCKDISGKMNVDSIHNGDYIKVKGVDFKASGAVLFEARVASATNGGSIELRLDSLNGLKIGTCTFQGTSGWQTWVTKSCEITGATGKHDLFFKFTGGNGLLFNFNWWKFTAQATETGRSANNSSKCNDKIEIISGIGRTQPVQLNFSLQVSRQNLDVSLYDLSGRKVMTLYTGMLFSQQLTLPINNANVKSGLYTIRVLLDNKPVAQKSLVL